MTTSNSFMHHCSCSSSHSSSHAGHPGSSGSALVVEVAEIADDEGTTAVEANLVVAGTALEDRVVAEDEETAEEDGGITAEDGVAEVGETAEEDGAGTTEEDATIVDVKVSVISTVDVSVTYTVEIDAVAVHDHNPD